MSVLVKDSVFSVCFTPENWVQKAELVWSLTMSSVSFDSYGGDVFADFNNELKFDNWQCDYHVLFSDRIEMARFSLTLV